MAEFFGQWEPPLLTAFASVLAALAALLVSPIINYIVSNRQSKTESKTTLEVAEKQIEASSISAKRQEWINALRDELAMILALVGEINRSPGEFERIHLRFITAFSKIELLINPLEEDHAALIGAIDSYYRAIIASEPSRKANESNLRRLLVLRAQLVLKKEWTVIRFGKPDETRLVEIRHRISEVQAAIAETERN